ncbi:MAG: ChrB protein [Dehalococcoidia bacterium]|nr:ChrB protein [Dehalococcoidia bacterium]
MKWFLFTYSLPPEPSRKRVFVWRQLKKAGALFTEGGWLLPKKAPLAAAIEAITHTVEEMGGTTNLYVVTHFNEAQEQRTIARFQQEREREYSEIISECRKTLRHIEREHQAHRFNLEELEGDLEKIKRWFSEAKKRDFWQVPAGKEVEELMTELEARLAAFTQKTYDQAQSSQEKAVSDCHGQT